MPLTLPSPTPPEGPTGIVLSLAKYEAVRKRIAELEANLASLTSDLEAVGLMVVRDDSRLSVAIRPGKADTLRTAFKL